MTKGDGIVFAIAKATGGITYQDPKFSQNWAGLKKAGLIRGAYHFLYAKDDAQKQAANFIKTVRRRGPKDLPPFLDVEITDKATKEAIVQNVLGWAKTVEKALGKQPIINTDVNFGNGYLLDPRLAHFKLWIADYNPGKEPQVPKEWQGTGWILWQYSQTGKIQGIEGNVDLDYFNGNKTDLRKLQ